MDRSWYVAKAIRQLSDPLVYAQVPDFPLKQLRERLLSLRSIHGNRVPSIDARTWQYLFHVPANGYQVCIFYLIPKVHKPRLVGRPICSSVGYVFEHLPFWLHEQLLPVLQVQATDLPDSTSLIRAYQTKQFPVSCLLFSFDVESLYPSIPIDLGLRFLRECILASGLILNPMVDLIMDAAALILNNNYLEFDGVFYKQV